MKFLKKIFTVLIILGATLYYCPATNADEIGDLIDSTPEPLKSLLEGLNNLTCETSSMINNYLREEFSHTCLTYPFASMDIAFLLSPIIYQQFISRLRIDDDKLSSLKDACALGNRINPNNRRLSFALCSNTQILAVKTAAFFIAFSEAIAAFIIGGSLDNAYQAFLDFLNPEYSSIFEHHNNTPVNQEGVFLDISIYGSAIIPWKVVAEKDALCVATMSFMGWMPVGCKYIAEPFPQSIYHEIVYGSDSVTSIQTPNLPTSPTHTVALNNLSCTDFNNCFPNVKSNSKTLIPISSTLVYCINQMLYKMMISPTVCTLDQANNFVSTAQSPSVLYQFQQNMSLTVQAMLTLYVIFYGFSVFWWREIKSDKIIIFVLQIILVSYFTFGLKSINPNGGSTISQDGMSAFAIPLMLNLANEFASWIMNASSSSLCDFKNAGYSSEYQFLSLWDALDCRVAHYIGLDMVAEFYADALTFDANWQSFDLISFPVPPYIYLLIAGIVTGIPMLISLALMYPILVISMAAFVVQTFVVSSIMLMILGILSVIFIPMVLFKVTREYFDKWLQLFISFSLQPMVAVAFVTIAFLIFDRGFYGACQYQKQTISSDLRTATMFVLDTNPQHYSTDDFTSCKTSLGYILNEPLSALFYTGQTTYDSIVSTGANAANSFSNKQSAYDFLGDGVSNISAIFFNSVSAVAKALVSFTLKILVACFLLYLLLQLSEKLTRLMAALSMGITIEGVTVSIKQMYNALSSVASQGMQAAQGNPIKSDLLGSMKNSANKDNVLFSSKSAINTNTTSDLTIKINQSTSASPKGSTSNATNVPDDMNQNQTNSNQSISPPILQQKAVEIQFGETQNNNSNTIASSLRSALGYRDSKDFEKQAGTTDQELARYIAVIANDKLYNNHLNAVANQESASETRFSKAKDVYKTSLAKYIENSQNAAEIDEMALKLENSLGGAAANRLRQINNDVLENMGINRVKTLQDIESFDDNQISNK